MPLKSRPAGLSLLACAPCRPGNRWGTWACQRLWAVMSPNLIIVTRRLVGFSASVAAPCVLLVKQELDPRSSRSGHSNRFGYIRMWLSRFENF